MNSKIKVLTINSKMAKRKRYVVPIEDLIDKEVPNTYEFFNVFSYHDAIDFIEQYKPEIIFIGHQKSNNSLTILEEIKHINPNVAIFVFLPIIDNEQDNYDKYMDLGVYKCYLTPPLVIDTLIHDMYVALNLE